MADKHTDSKKAEKVEKTEKAEQTKTDEKKDENGKERAINPMAMRPEGVHVTITDVKPNIKLIKKLFGF